MDFFGIAPGTFSVTNTQASVASRKNTTLVNVSVTKDKLPYWKELARMPMRTKVWTF